MNSTLSSLRKEKGGKIRSALQSRGNVFHGKLFSCVRARDISHATVRRISVFSCDRRRRNGEWKNKARRADRERLAIPSPVPSFPYVDSVVRTIVSTSTFVLCLCNAKELLPSQRGITILTREFNVPCETARSYYAPFDMHICINYANLIAL